MTTLTVDLADRAYPIHIGPGLLDQSALYLPHVRGRKAVVVTNEVVGPLYAQRVVDALTRGGKEVGVVELPDGEAAKQGETLDRIYTALLEMQCDRKTTLLALGGGVIGDLTGFAAATFMRGIDFIQIPTTLLSQVDSSVGGKTGINHPLGKNMIGAFHQPKAVIADIETLATLPDRELSAGLAEVVKYGAIVDAEFFAWCEAHMAALRARDAEALTHAIRRSCELKAEIVRQDEHEQGVRALLNFGHTFGHAIEAGMGYGNWLHGEAVGAGMMMAAHLSARLGQLEATDLDRLAALVRAAGLPTQAPPLGAERFLALMAGDKKAENGSVRYVLLRGLGGAEVRAVDAPTVRAALHALGQQ